MKPGLLSDRQRNNTHVFGTLFDRPGHEGTAGVASGGRGCRPVLGFSPACSGFADLLANQEFFETLPGARNCR